MKSISITVSVILHYQKRVKNIKQCFKYLMTSENHWCRVYAQKQKVCKQEHQHAYKTDFLLCTYWARTSWKRRHRLFFFFSPFSEFGANVEMFTQIIAQGHFKWTELTIRMCTWTLAPTFVTQSLCSSAWTCVLLVFEIIWRIPAVWGRRRAVSVYGTKGRVGWWNVSSSLSVELINVTLVTFLLTQWYNYLLFLIFFLLKLKSFDVRKVNCTLVYRRLHHWGNDICRFTEF